MIINLISYLISIFKFSLEMLSYYLMDEFLLPIRYCCWWRVIALIFKMLRWILLFLHFIIEKLYLISRKSLSKMLIWSFLIICWTKNINVRFIFIRLVIGFHNFLFGYSIIHHIKNKKLIILSIRIPQLL